MNFDSVKDSGRREEFSTGSRRDTQAGKGRPDLIPIEPLRRLALHYENGAKKYGDRNWEKGQPLSRYYASAMRHMWAYMIGDYSEDHLAATVWNIFSLIATQERIIAGKLPRELDDIGAIQAYEDHMLEEGSKQFTIPLDHYTVDASAVIRDGTVDTSVEIKKNGHTIKSPDNISTQNNTTTYTDHIKSINSVSDITIITDTIPVHDITLQRNRELIREADEGYVLINNSPRVNHAVDVHTAVEKAIQEDKKSKQLNELILTVDTSQALKAINKLDDALQRLTDHITTADELLESIRSGDSDEDTQHIEDSVYVSYPHGTYKLPDTGETITGGALYDRITNGTIRQEVIDFLEQSIQDYGDIFQALADYDK